MIITSTSFLGLFAYSIFYNANIELVAKAALSITESMVAGINASEVQNMLQTREKTEYLNELQHFIDAIQTRTGASVYIIDARYDQEVVCLTYALPSGDDDPFLYTESADFYPTELFNSIETGRAGTTTIYYSGEDYGFMLSAFSPIMYNNQVIAFAVADFDVNSVLVQAREFGFRMIIAIILFNLIFISIAIWYTRRNIAKPIQKLSYALSNMSKGNIDVDIDIKSNNEIGQLASDFLQIKSTLSSLLNSLSLMSNKHNAGDNEAMIDANNFQGVYRLVAENINEMVINYVVDMDATIKVVTDFGEGNFETTLKEFPGKKASVNRAMENLRSNLKQVKDEIGILATHALNGQLSYSIKTEQLSGDWRELSLTMNRLIETISEPIKESVYALDKMAKGDFSIQMQGNYSGDFKNIQDAFNFSSSEIFSYIMEIKEVLSRIAANDLRVEIKRNYIGQFYEIKDSINNIISNLNVVICGINLSAEQVAIAVETLTSSSHELAIQANTQVLTVTNINTLTNEINQKINENSKNSSKAIEISSASKENAREGSEKMHKMLEAMEEIQASSNNISSVIKIIQDIAFQTNLLALNAAVEAARAGEMGKGFAVVAEEVRNLAIRSQTAVKNSADLISLSSSKVDEGRQIAQSTAESLKTIVDNVTTVSKIIDDIAESSKHQEASIQGVCSEINLISETVQQNSASAQESSSLAEELLSQSIELKNRIESFSLK